MNQIKLRWLVVEDALRDRQGHWFEYVSTFKQGFNDLGDEVTLLADRQAQPFIIQALGAQPVLPQSIWHRMGDGAGVLTRYLRVPLHGLQTVMAVGRYLRQFSNFDVIFVPTVLVHHLLGWVYLIKRQIKKHPIRVILFFPNAPVVHNLSDNTYTWTPSPTTALLRFLLKSLTDEVNSGKVVLGAETYAMQRALTTLTGLPFTYFPHPVAPLPAPEQERAPNSKLVMASYGGARQEKGSDILFQAVTKFSDRYPHAPVQFILQCLQGFDDERQGLNNNPAVEWITRYFMEGEYAQYLGQTDVMLLPYRPGSYALRVSRVVIDALVNGIPVVVTGGTTLAEQASQWGAALLCDSEDVYSFVEAMGQMVQQQEKLRSRAKERMSMAQDHFSVANFKRCYLYSRNLESL